MPRNMLGIALACLCLLVGARAAASPDAPTFTVTVSGKVTGPSGPVAGAWIGVNAVEDWKEVTTDASGNYGVVVTTSGRFFFHVRPPLAARLSQINLYREGMTASFKQDFALTSGHLLAVRPVGRDGSFVEGGYSFELQALVSQSPANQWYNLEWDPAGTRYQAVLPPDISFHQHADLPASRDGASGH